MRRPRDLAKYSPAAEAAKGLRQIADDIERDADAYPLVKWYINLSAWNPSWEKSPPSLGIEVHAKARYEP